jgi:hypothetical protein
MGVLLEVAGGTCTQLGYCPVKTACIGCPSRRPTRTSGVIPSARQAEIDGTTACALCLVNMVDA